MIGLGRFGTAVATTLFNLGHSVLGIDRDMGHVQRVMPLITHAVQADATDEEALRSLGFRNFDAAIVSVGPDQESSILATVLLKDLGVPHVVAKARSPMHGRILERVGADRVVYPEREMGVRVAHRLVSQSILDVVELDEDMSMMECTATAELAGRTLKDLRLRGRWGITVLALKRNQKMIPLVGPDTKVEDNDTMMLVGRTADLTRFAGHLAEGEPASRRTGPGKV